MADSSVKGLVFGNALALGLAIWQDWPLVLLLWPFWIQSAALGVFNVLRMILGPPPRPDPASRPRPEGSAEISPGALRAVMAGFFAVHYGVFHLAFLAYLTLLSYGDPSETGFDATFAAAPGWSDWLGFLAIAGSLVWAMRAELPGQLAADRRHGEMNMAARMLLPYLRMLPILGLMVLGAVFGDALQGSLAAWALWLFVALKTLADVGGHALDRGAGGNLRSAEDGSSL